MSDREKQLEIILKQLISAHFYGEGLEWNWREGESLFSRDKGLWVQIYQQFPELIESK